MSKMLPAVVIKPDGVENKEYKEILFNKMQELWISKKMVDITFQVDGSVIQAHQFVLAASSKHLCDALLQIRSTTQTRNVVMDLSRGGFKMVALKELLNYIYLGKMKLNYTTYNDVRKVAKILQISQVVAVCDIFEGSFIRKMPIGRPVAIRREGASPCKQIHGPRGSQKKFPSVLLQKLNYPNSMKEGEKNKQNDEPNNQTDNTTPDTVTSYEEVSAITEPGHRQNQVSILRKSASKTPDSAPRKMRKLSHNRAGSPVTERISAHCDGPHGICNETENKTVENLSFTGPDSYNLPEAKSLSDLSFGSSKSSEAGHGNVSEVTVEIEGIEHTFEIENLGDENEDKNLAISETDSAQETKCVPTEAFSDVKVKIEPPENSCDTDNSHISTELNSYNSPVKKTPACDHMNYSEMTVKIESIENGSVNKDLHMKGDTANLIDSDTCGIPVIGSFSQEDFSHVAIKIEPTESFLQKNNVVYEKMEDKNSSQSQYGEYRNLKSSQHANENTDLTNECVGDSSDKLLECGLLPLKEIKQEPVDISENENIQVVDYTFNEEGDPHTSTIEKDSSKVHVDEATRSTILENEPPESNFETACMDRIPEAPDDNICNIPSSDVPKSSIEINKVLCSQLENAETKRKGKVRTRKGKKFKHKGRRGYSVKRTGKEIKVSFQKSPANDTCVDLAYGSFSSVDTVVGSLGTLSHKPQSTGSVVAKAGSSKASVSTGTLSTQTEYATSLSSSEKNDTETDPNVPDLLSFCKNITAPKIPILSQSLEGRGDAEHKTIEDTIVPLNTDNTLIPFSSLLSTSSKFSIMCVVCGYNFPSISSCEKHILNAHCAGRVYEDGPAIELPTETMKKGPMAMYLCSCCDYMTSNQRFIFIHRLYHHEVPINTSMITPYCKYCRILLHKDTDLEKHKLTHKNHYACTICEKRFLGFHQIHKHIDTLHVTSRKTYHYVRRVYCQEINDILHLLKEEKT